MFAPGRSVLYSNFGFDLLAIALSEAASGLSIFSGTRSPVRWR